MRMCVNCFVLFSVAVFFCFSALHTATGSPPLPADNFAPIDWQHDNRRKARSLVNIDIGEARTVRLVYILPNDLDFRPEVVQRMKDEIRSVQAFYGEQMQANGYGARSFRVETDAAGEPLIHRIDSQHSDKYFRNDTAQRMLDETRRVFDTGANIYIIVLENKTGLIGNYPGLGSPSYKTGGVALMASGFSWTLLAHELGHAFGLRHDFRDVSHIMGGGGNQPRLSDCNARFLAAHPYFDPDVPTEKGIAPTINLNSAFQYPPGSKGIPVHLLVGDEEGLHQILIFGPTRSPHSTARQQGIVQCHEFSGEQEALVEFDYYGGGPPDDGIGLTYSSTHQLVVQAVDIRGNFTQKTIRFIELSPGQIASFTEHEKTIHSLAFSPIGSILASASADNRIILWDVEMRKMLDVLHDAASFAEAPTSIAFSPDGQTLAVGTIGATVMLWDMVTRSHIDTLVGHDSSQWVTCVAFSPDGKILASGSGDRTIRLWDAMTGSGITTLEGHTHWVTSLSFPPNGNLLASGSHDGAIKLWNIETEKIIDTLEGHAGFIRSISFSHDGRTLASTAKDFTLKLWDIETTRFFASVGGPHSSVLHTSFSPAGNILVLGGQDITLLDLETSARIASLGISGQVEGLTFTRDGGQLAASTWDGSTSAIKIWETSALTSISDRTVPDASLRKALRIYLGREAGVAITHDDLAALTNFTGGGAAIFALVGLESATNLEYLTLGGNFIINLSPIAGLTKLHTLFLDRNSISDVTPLKGLTNLKTLDLSYNIITEISPVTALINLERLSFNGNKVSDTSALTGLTNLTSLQLAVNSISDISPLLANSGLGEGDTLFLRKNPLNYEAVNSHIPRLQDRGVTVSFIDRTPTTLEPISGDEQQGVPSAPLLDPFVVEVRDEHGDVFEGVPVTFNVPDGGGRLSRTNTTTDADGRAQSVLTLGQRTGTIIVTVSAAEITEIAKLVTFTVVSEETPQRIRGDVNDDGVVNIFDLVQVAANFAELGENNADVNGDGVVDILDLVQVAGAIGGADAAPSARSLDLSSIRAADVAGWLTQVQGLDIGDMDFQRGIRFLEQLLAALTPKGTTLLPNYPNPFNPETWIPYQLAQGAEVEIAIYDA